MRWNIALSVSATALILCIPAYGQEEKPETGERPGFEAGNFRITPTVSVSESYDTNIYTEDQNAIGDYLTRVIPEIQFKTVGKPYTLDIKGRLEQVWFADETQNHYLNAGASARYKYKSANDLQWDAFASLSYLHEMPGDDEADPAGDASEPLPYYAMRANASVRKDFDAFNMGFNLTPRVAFMRRDYENGRRVDGTLIDNSMRDRNEYIAGGQLAHKIAKDYEVFLDTEFAPRVYDEDAISDRDSNGGSYLAGLRYKPSHDIIFEMAAGATNRSYDNSAYDNIATVDVSAKVSIKTAPDSALKFTFNRYIGEVTDASAGGTIVNDMRAGVTRDFTDNLSGSIEGRFKHSDYQGGRGSDDGLQDRSDRYYGLTLGLKYDLTDVTALTADYSAGRNSSNRDSAEYTQNVLMLGVKSGL